MNFWICKRCINIFGRLQGHNLYKLLPEIGRLVRRPRSHEDAIVLIESLQAVEETILNGTVITNVTRDEHGRIVLDYATFDNLCRQRHTKVVTDIRDEHGSLHVERTPFREVVL